MWSLIAPAAVTRITKRSIYPTPCAWAASNDLPEYRLSLAFRNSRERTSMIRFEFGVAEGKRKPRL